MFRRGSRDGGGGRRRFLSKGRIGTRRVLRKYEELLVWCQLMDKIKCKSLTIIDSEAEVALPPPIIDEINKRIDVGPAGAAPDDGGALDDGELGEVLERVD